MTRVRQCLALAVLAAIIAGGLVYFRYSRDLNQVRTAIAKDARIAQTTTGPIQYGERGAGAPLLSIHGAGGGYDQGLANAADFVGSGFRIVAPSRFGYLDTPAPADPSPEAQADAHAALLDTLGIDAAVVVGISAGARSAIALALRHPERVSALILIVPASFEPSNPVAIEESRGSKLAFRLVNTGADFAWWALETFAPTVLIRFVGVPPEIVAAASEAEQERVRRIVHGIQPLSKRVRGINLDSIPDAPPPPFENIRIRTLIVAARDDLFNTLPVARFAASRIPNARLEIYETGGHLLVGHRQDLRELLGRFIEIEGAR